MQSTKRRNPSISENIYLLLLHVSRVLQNSSGALYDVLNVVGEDRAAHFSGFGSRLVGPDGRAESILVSLVFHLTNLTVDVHDLISAPSIIVGVGLLPSLPIRVPIGYIILIPITSLTLERQTIVFNTLSQNGSIFESLPRRGEMSGKANSHRLSGKRY